MLILKRLAIWLLEKFVEACLLGALLGYLMVRSSGDTSLTAWNGISGFYVWGAVVATFLFLHGYYVTTAFFGVVWRSAEAWVYSTITSALFILHTHIVFMRIGADFTPQARAMELPFALGGASIAFSCALAGSWVLSKWLDPNSNRNAYAFGSAYPSALGLTLLVFALTNTANFLRPVVGSSAFRLYGLPFTFYREGGFVKDWVWRPGELVWRGMVADIAVFAAVVLLLGRALQTVRDR
jgi:hypothetical protein